MTSDELSRTREAQDTQPPRQASPSGSFYAMSDDEEGEYNTITHTETGKGVKLLYSKSKVRPHHVATQLRYTSIRCVTCIMASTRKLTLPLNIGLHPSNTVLQRQYPRLHSPPSAKARARRQTLLCRLPKLSNYSLFRPLTGMAARIPARRGRQHLRQGRPLRRRLSA